MSDPLAPDVWARVERLFAEVMAMPEHERAARLAGVIAGLGAAGIEALVSEQQRAVRAAKRT